MRIVGIGTDVVSVARIEKILAKHPGFVDRVLSQEERLKLLDKSADSAHQQERLKSLDKLQDLTQYIANRWSAKEAISKAMGVGLSQYCRMSDISVLNDHTGRPFVKISGSTKLYLGKYYPNYHIHISMSHDEYAVAFCIITVE